MTREFPASARLLERIKKVMPAASSTYSKSYRYYCEGAAPAFLASGKGSHVLDVDGHEYIDYVMALGPVIVGYNDERINRAMIDQLEKGISFSLSTELEVRLAEKLVEIIPCAEMVKFMKSGSEATSAAVRLARAHTGRDMVFCCGYHGWQDWYIGTTQNHLGVPQCVRELTKTFVYNDLDGLDILFRQNQGKVAAVIMEPVSFELPRAGYLQSVKELAHRHGALLIFDEVITGFRMGLSGAQGYFGVIPDLAAFGKAMGNGAAISAVAGPADVMKQIERGAFISTTFGGECLAIAAALKTIEILEQEKPLDYFTRLGARFLEGISRLIGQEKLEHVVQTAGIPSHFALRFEGDARLDTYDLFSVFQQEVLQNGILMIGSHNFCLAHNDADIDLSLEAYAQALPMVRKALEKGSLEGILRGGKFRPVFRRDSVR